MWASICETVFSLFYVIGLVILMVSLFSQQTVAQAAANQWTNIQDYALHYADNPFTMRVGLFVQADVFLTGLAILVIFLVLHEMIDQPRKIITRIGSAIALILATLSCMTYYIQIASVHQTILHGGDLQGLAQFAESNGTSPAMATLQLSWTLFYGLATLVISPIFNAKGLEKWIKWAFIFNGVIGVAVGIGYAAGLTILVPISIFALIATAFAYVLLAILFYRASQGESFLLGQPS
jgi:hypothetical protein